MKLFGKTSLSYARRLCLASRNTSRLMANVTSANDHSIAFVTCPNEDVAKRIARGLVDKKLAACVNIIPNLTSIYVWEGKVEEDAEVLLKIKTMTSVVPQLSNFVRDNHPNVVPEVISVKIDQGIESYLEWMSDAVQKPVK